MKTLIIGGGAVSEMFHLPAAIELFGRESVYLAEPDQQRCDLLKDKFRLNNVNRDYQRFLKEANMAVLATPPHLHLNILKDCIDNEIPVLCEKPLVLTEFECDELLNYTINNRILVGVCHTYRIFPNRKAIREMIRRGEFGKTVKMEIQEGDPLDWPSVTGYHLRKDIVSGGVMLDSGIHSLDFIIWCFGMPLEIEYYDDSIGGLESNAKLKFSFTDNNKAIFRISRTCSLRNTIFIEGEKLNVSMDLFNMNSFTKMKNDKTECVSIKEDNSYNWRNIAVHQLNDFVNAVIHKKTPLCTLEDGVKIVKLLNKCYDLKKSREMPDKLPIQGICF